MYLWFCLSYFVNLKSFKSRPNFIFISLRSKFQNLYGEKTYYYIDCQYTDQSVSASIHPSIVSWRPGRYYWRCQSLWSLYRLCDHSTNVTSIMGCNRCGYKVDSLCIDCGFIVYYDIIVLNSLVVNFGVDK